MEAYGQGESETLRLLSQTHLQSPTNKEMHRYGPYRSPAEPQMPHNFAHHLHQPSFHVGTSSINFCFGSCIRLKWTKDDSGSAHLLVEFNSDHAGS